MYRLSDEEKKMQLSLGTLVKCEHCYSVRHPNDVRDNGVCNDCWEEWEDEEDLAFYDFKEKDNSTGS